MIPFRIQFFLTAFLALYIGQSNAAEIGSAQSPALVISGDGLAHGDTLNLTIKYKTGSVVTAIPQGTDRKLTADLPIIIPTLTQSGATDSFEITVISYTDVTNASKAITRQTHYLTGTGGKIPSNGLLVSVGINHVKTGNNSAYFTASDDAKPALYSGGAVGTFYGLLYKCDPFSGANCAELTVGQQTSVQKMFQSHGRLFVWAAGQNYNVQTGGLYSCDRFLRSACQLVIGNSANLQSNSMIEFNNNLIVTTNGFTYVCPFSNSTTKLGTCKFGVMVDEHTNQVIRPASAQPVSSTVVGSHIVIQAQQNASLLVCNAIDYITKTSSDTSFLFSSNVDASRFPKCKLLFSQTTNAPLTGGGMAPAWTGNRLIYAHTNGLKSATPSAPSLWDSWASTWTRKSLLSRVSAAGAITPTDLFSATTFSDGYAATFWDSAKRKTYMRFVGLAYQPGGTLSKNIAWKTFSYGYPTESRLLVCNQDGFNTLGAVTAGFVGDVCANQSKTLGSSFVTTFTTGAYYDPSKSAVLSDRVWVQQSDGKIWWWKLGGCSANTTCADGGSTAAFLVQANRAPLTMLYVP